MLWNNIEFGSEDSYDYQLGVFDTQTLLSNSVELIAYPLKGNIQLTYMNVILCMVKTIKKYIY